LVWIAASAAILAAASCVPSLQPLFEDEDLIFEPGLLGSWTGEDGPDRWTFERGAGRLYRLTAAQSEFETGGGRDKPARIPGQAMAFVGRLGRLGGRLFLDLTPDESGPPPVRNELYNMHIVPAHTFWRVRIAGDELTLEPFSPDWLGGALKEGRLKIAHVRTGGRVILTASTAELQAFIRTYADDADAFPAPDAPLRRASRTAEK
jgi:hypothetical protein